MLFKSTFFKTVSYPLKKNLTDRNDNSSAYSNSWVTVFFYHWSNASLLGWKSKTIQKYDTTDHLFLFLQGTGRLYHVNIFANFKLTWKAIILFDINKWHQRERSILWFHWARGPERAQIVWYIGRKKIYQGRNFGRRRPCFVAQ